MRLRDGAQGGADAGGQHPQAVAELVDQAHQAPEEVVEAVEEPGPGPLAQLVEEGADGRRAALEGAPQALHQRGGVAQALQLAAHDLAGWRRPASAKRAIASRLTSKRRMKLLEVPGEGLPQGDGGALEALRGVDRGQDLGHPHQLQQALGGALGDGDQGPPGVQDLPVGEGATPPPPGAGPATTSARGLGGAGHLLEGGDVALQLAVEGDDAVRMKSKHPAQGAERLLRRRDPGAQLEPAEQPAAAAPALHALHLALQALHGLPDLAQLGRGPVLGLERRSAARRRWAPASLLRPLLARLGVGLAGGLVQQGHGGPDDARRGWPSAPAHVQPKRRQTMRSLRVLAGPTRRPGLFLPRGPRCACPGPR